MIPIWATLHMNKNLTETDGKVNAIGLKAILMKGNEEYEWRIPLKVPGMNSVKSENPKSKLSQKTTEMTTIVIIDKKW